MLTPPTKSLDVEEASWLFTQSEPVASLELCSFISSQYSYQGTAAKGGGIHKSFTELSPSAVHSLAFLKLVPVFTRMSVVDLTRVQGPVFNPSQVKVTRKLAQWHD